ncbi:hypothetical protein C2845_PM15G25560 [Panicum miliaceum]|uniref:Uncharacterized protein n=1 Tax=Panicum miliaceum TaxID=4540 RepID=A0A3L6QA27_PANMI|nr:hypothetical protein C2845_PM15G25560 [Panicum miliaceum]
MAPTVEATKAKHSTAGTSRVEATTLILVMATTAMVTGVEVGPEGVFAQGDLTALGRDVVAWPAGPAVAGKLAAMVVGAGPAGTVPINSTLEATHSWAQPKERRLGLNQVQAMARQRKGNTRLLDRALKPRLAIIALRKGTRQRSVRWRCTM